MQFSTYVELEPTELQLVPSTDIPAQPMALPTPTACSLHLVYSQVHWSTFSVSSDPNQAGYSAQTRSGESQVQISAASTKNCMLEYATR
jgi:hypothetical protein